MAEEQVTDNQVTDVTPVTADERKANIVKKIIEYATVAMKAAFSKGEADTVWYKKGLYYTGAVILGAIVYAFTYYGIEILDWVQVLLNSLF